MSYQVNRVKQQNNRRTRVSLTKQRGVVIVVALFIVALVAALAYVMMVRLERDTRRTSLILRDAQAEFYAQGSINWGLDVLRNNWERKAPNQLVDIMPMKSAVQDVKGYKISSTIYDMQSRFNLNNLSDAQYQADFMRLMQIVDPKLAAQQAQVISLGIADWIAPVAQQQEKESYYFHVQPPYRSAHRLMQHASELKLVRGVTPALFNALQPYVTALPGIVLINVQTAPAPVLMTLSPTLTYAGAHALEQLRKRTPFISPQVFLSTDIAKNTHILENKITVVSNYFLIETQVDIENQHLVIYTLVERTNQERKVQIRILSQSKGIE